MSNLGAHYNINLVLKPKGIYLPLYVNSVKRWLGNNVSMYAADICFSILADGKILYVGHGVTEEYDCLVGVIMILERMYINEYIIVY